MDFRRCKFFVPAATRGLGGDRKVEEERRSRITLVNKLPKVRRVCVLGRWEWEWEW